MENQHRLISGCRDLSQDDVGMINAIRLEGKELQDLVALVKAQPEVDQRWVAIAQTDLQKGMMALVRAVARPESF